MSKPGFPVNISVFGSTSGQEAGSILDVQYSVFRPFHVWQVKASIKQFYASEFTTLMALVLPTDIEESLLQI